MPPILVYHGNQLAPITAITILALIDSIFLFIPLPLPLPLPTITITHHYHYPLLPLPTITLWMIIFNAGSRYYHHIGLTIITAAISTGTTIAIFKFEIMIL